MLIMVSFEVEEENVPLLDSIVRRACKLYGTTNNVVDITMDIKACHANGCPLDFKRLLEFDDFNFMHDINGINHHIDRDTGKLTNCFLPKSAK